MSKPESIMLTLSPSLSPPRENADTISTLIVCKICLLDYTLEQMYSISQCHCTFCLECVKTYVSTSIDNGNVLSISCPNLYCRLHGEIEQSEVKALVSADMFDRYCRLRFEQEIEFDPTRTFCPKPHCRAVCPVLPVPVTVTGTVTFADNNARPISCPECGMQFCLQCKSAWHDKQTCDENMMKVEGVVYGIPFFSFAEDAKIKRCPTCHVPIERNSGCAQMMCRRCKHVFCWYCLASLDDDFLLRHYDRGRCKNKLGHSRASVLFHRMQVVGIFAGFGILLLIVSPFLLLAVPCLLCSGCRPCRRCDDFDITTDGSGTTHPPPAASL